MEMITDLDIIMALLGAVVGISIGRYIKRNRKK
jgi:multisubunit Na+/H+ antiporter MnhF subunit